MPRTRVGYGLVDRKSGAEQRVAYDKLISNKRKRLDKNIWNFIFYRFEFSAILRKLLQDVYHE